MNKTKKNGIAALSIVIAITIILGSLNFLDQKKMFSSENKKTDIMKTFSTNKNGYIAKIHINGVIQEANRTYSQKWLVETIKKLNRNEGITIVLITHYMDEAVQADRVIVVDSGEIKIDDTPERVFAHVDEIKALGLDVPQATELVHRCNLSPEKTILNTDECVDYIKSLLEG